MNLEEKQRKERLICQEIANNKRRGPRKRRQTVRKILAVKQAHRDAEGALLTGKVVPAVVSALEARQSATLPEIAEVDQIREQMDALRLKWMARAVQADALDPASLSGEVRLPTEVMEILEKENFSPEDMKRCALAIGRDNLAELVALCKNRDARVQLEAFRLLYQFMFGDKKLVEHTGPGGGAQQIVVRLVAPDGKERTVDRPQLEPAKNG